MLSITTQGRGGFRLALGDRIRKGRFESSRTVDAAAAYLGVGSDWLQSCLEKGAGEYAVPTDRVPPSGPEPAFIRGLKEKADRSMCYASFTEALNVKELTIAEPLIYWQDADRLCAVDVDFHMLPYEQRPTEQHLLTRFATIQPVPRWSWVTHGRGLRLMYEAKDGFTASELAAVAAVCVTQLEAGATVELKTITRHPTYPNAIGRMCSAVMERVQTTNVSALHSWHDGRGAYDPEELQEWLESHGFEIGGRYEHSKCPVEPHVASHGTPVAVYESGVYCYGCNGHNVRRGNKTPGWFPFEVFLGSPAPSIVSQCVRNLTHWEHARYIFQAHYPLSESILKGAYGAMLKGAHGSESRLAGVWVGGRDVVRYYKRWGTLTGETYQLNSARAILERLPAAQYVAEDGKVKVDTERVARFVQPTSLEYYGYPHLHPVYGHPIYSVHQTPRYPYEITMFKGPGQAPKYVPVAQRIGEVEAWNRLEVAFPGLNRNAIQLLIAAKGCAEAVGTWPPFLFISGPTASSKTTSVSVAAAIAGDQVYSVPCISDDQRVRAAISEAKDRGTFCVFNEAVKDGMRRNKGDKIAAMEFALSLTADSLSHKLYVGPVEMGALPVLVWTDVEVPQEAKEHAQLARRFIHVHLSAKVDWHKSMMDTGMGQAELLRRHYDQRYIDAADAILSYTIDRFFRAPTTFEEIAKKLGFSTLAESAEAQSQVGELQRFFELVQAAPKVDGTVLIDPHSSSALAQLWRDLADPPSFLSSQRIAEASWPHVLQTTCKVRCNVMSRRTRVRVSFEGLTDGSICRYRDSEPGGSARSGSETIHLPSFDPDDDVGSEGGGSGVCLDSTRVAVCDAEGSE